MRFYNLYFWLVIIAFTISGAGSVVAAPDFESLTIEDYVTARQVSELALSWDGELIVYAVISTAAGGSGVDRSVIVQKAEANAKPINITIAQDASHLAWIPGTHEVAYIANVDGRSQVFATNIDTGKTQQLTFGSERPLTFKFSNDGKKMGWISQSGQRIESNQPSLYNRLHDGDTGVIIDHKTVRLTHFVNPLYREVGSYGERSLWVRDGNKNPVRSSVPGYVTGFEWSSSGEKLSVRFLADTNPADPFASLYTSIGIFNISSGGFSVIAAANSSSVDGEAVYYLGGEWVADAEEIFVRRVITSSFWRSRREWKRISIGDDEIPSTNDLEWNEIKFYPASAQFVPTGFARPVVNGVHKGLRSVYEIDPTGLRTASFVKDIEGDLDLVRFSSDQRVSVFVNQSLVRAPEIFVLQDGVVQQITTFNQSINSKRMPNAREVNWRGEDGIKVQGWLLMPPETTGKIGPLPMVTFLHGGPTIPMTNSFAQYYTLYGGVWPYPFEVLALNGIAIFIPNYRGTDSFGHDYSNPKHSDVEALNDVVLGIEHLIATGVADEDKLGIAGHSHGAWLGALVMTRMKNFVAASFGEGPQNNILTYIFSPGYLYEKGYHKLWGTGLYQTPQRYIETSPVFYFEGLNTAVLFEAGVESQALSMMGSPKAAHLAGMPTEFVAYPKTGHNIRDPKLKKEVAHRNLDWFSFWVLGHEGRDTAKAEQYDRWRDMRHNRCVDTGITPPTYCNDNYTR